MNPLAGGARLAYLVAVRRTAPAWIALVAMAGLLVPAGSAWIAAPPAASAVVAARAPAVINGTPDSPLASAAVALEMGRVGWCTGTLWQPRIVISATHCFMDATGTRQVVQARDVIVYPPGGDTGAGPARARVIRAVFDQDWVPLAASEGSTARIPVESDIAFLVLDRPIGQPAWTRMATAEEIAELAASGAAVVSIGYGLTGPFADPASRMSSVPMAFTSTLDPRFSAPDRFFTAGDGISGNCHGDSGGPYLAQVGAEVLYLGPVRGISGPPCAAVGGGSAIGSLGPIASYRSDLGEQALAIVRASGASRSCIAGPDVERECWTGARWTYAYCWSGRKAALQRRDASSWVTVARFTGRRSPDCDARFPYLIEFRRVAEGATVEYRLYVPRQSGIRRAATDAFTVTAS